MSRMPVNNLVRRDILPVVQSRDAHMAVRWQKPALVLVFALISAAAGAQDNPCLERTVLVSALENTGRQASGFQADDFDARIGGQKIQVTSVRPAPADRRVVFLLDVSGSMGGRRVHDKWHTTVAIGNQVLSSAPASVSLAMIAFSDKFLDLVDFGPPARSEIASKLQKYEAMSPLGRTPLLDTVDRAIGMLTPSRPADSIYLISDAGDNHSKDTVDRVRERLRTSGVRLDLIYIREDVMASSMDPHFSDDKPDIFSTLALESGGWVLDVPASLTRERAQVRGAITAAVQAMLSDPLVQVQLGLPHELAKWRRWDLRVLDARGRKKNELMLLYPHFLGPKACVNSSNQ
jgi:hypothetical protein